MVCNWRYSNPNIGPPGTNTVYYNYHNTGKDGLYWDTIQLIYLADLGQCTILNNSQKFSAAINAFTITQNDIEKSYELMLKDWLSGGQLWDLEDALKATRKVVDYADRNTSS
jgi:hypothetical protein